jgi:hypothetical protein
LLQARAAVVPAPEKRRQSGYGGARGAYDFTHVALSADLWEALPAQRCRRATRRGWPVRTRLQAQGGGKQRRPARRAAARAFSILPAVLSSSVV